MAILDLIFGPLNYFFPFRGVVLLFWLKRKIGPSDFASTTDVLTMQVSHLFVRFLCLCLLGFLFVLLGFT